MNDNDLILREAAIEAAIDGADDWDGGYNPTREEYIRERMAKVPAVDAALVMHGQWDGYNADYSDWLRNDGKPIFISCCVCNNVVLNNGSASWNYCPNCGARMDGERRDGE